MSRRRAIYLATALALVVALGAYFFRGIGSTGSAAAARNTARFSGLLFAVALVARSARFRSLFAARWQLFFAFLAAHGVHFAAVLAVAFFDAASPLHRLDLSVIGTLASGFSIVLAAAVTAGPGNAPFRSRAHTFFFYLVALIFTVAFFAGTFTQHPLSALNLGAMLIAWTLRALPAPRSAVAAA